MSTKNYLLLCLAIGSVVLAAVMVFANKDNLPFDFKTIPASARQFTPSNQAACSGITKTDNPRLEAYLVSMCPFGLQMERALADLVKDSPALANQIKVRYIGKIDGGRMTSMHGTNEAQENLRQICVREEQPLKYWDYIACHIKKGNSSGCLDSAGINAAGIDDCMADSLRGIKYAAEDADLTARYGIKGSPTLVINGQEISEFDFGGRSPNAIKDVLCCGFSSAPEACFSQLNNQEPATAYSETYLSQPKK